MSRLIKFSTFAFLAFGSSLACANAGIPMLALAWPAQWLALVLIVLLECEILRRALHLSFRQLIWPTAKANIVSTLVGTPIAWFVMLIPTLGIGIGLSQLPASVEIPAFVNYALLPLTAAWVEGESVWQVYFAFVFLAIPFCLVSVFIEERVLRRSFLDQSTSSIHSFTVRANIWSYILLSTLALIFPLTA